MYIVEIDFDREQKGQTKRERRWWPYRDRARAGAEADRFSRLAHAGGIRILRNGDKITFQECRLYDVDTNDSNEARQLIEADQARLLVHAFNPAIDDPAYWDEVLDWLEREDAAGRSEA